MSIYSQCFEMGGIDFSLKISGNSFGGDIHFCEECDKVIAMALLGIAEFPDKMLCNIFRPVVPEQDPPLTTPP